MQHWLHRPALCMNYTQFKISFASTTSLWCLRKGSFAWQYSPFSELPIPNLQCSPLGVIPKKGGTWHIIMDLSSLHGASINDHISKEEYTLHATFNQALALVAQHALMAKLDLKHVFLPLPLADGNLLRMLWKGKYYIDPCLPFSLRC